MTKSSATSRSRSHSPRRTADASRTADAGHAPDTGRTAIAGHIADAGHIVDAATLRSRDLDLVLAHGREIAPGTLRLTRAAARAEIARLRHVIASLERLGRDDRAIQLNEAPLWT